MIKVYFNGPIQDSQREAISQIWSSCKPGDYAISPNNCEMTCYDPRDVNKSIRLQKFLRDVRQKGGRVENL